MVDAAPANPDAAGAAPSAFTHTPVIWDGTLPSPKASVAKELAKVALENQRAQTALFYNLLVQDDNTRDLHQLNHDTTPVVCALVNVPKLKMVKLVYLLKYGAAGFMKNSPLDNKILVLTGDGDNKMGLPKQMLLPPLVITSTEVTVMTQEMFLEHIAACNGSYTYPLRPQRQLAGVVQVDVLKLATIPAYLVYDMFDGMADAANILERVLGSPFITEPFMEHLKTFILCCISVTLVNNNKVHLTHEEFLSALDPPNATRDWATNAFPKHFLGLKTAETTATKTADTTSPDYLS